MKTVDSMTRSLKSFYLQTRWHPLTKYNDKSVYSVAYRHNLMRHTTYSSASGWTFSILSMSNHAWYVNYYLLADNKNFRLVFTYSNPKDEVKNCILKTTVYNLYYYCFTTGHVEHFYWVPPVELNIPENTHQPELCSSPHRITEEFPHIYDSKKHLYDANF